MNFLEKRCDEFFKASEVNGHAMDIFEAAYKIACADCANELIKQKYFRIGRADLLKNLFKKEFAPSAPSGMNYCKSCNLKKARKKTNERNGEGYVYRDENGRRWCGRLCPSCTLSYNRRYK